MQTKPKQRLSWGVVLPVVAVLCVLSFLMARWIVNRNSPIIRTATLLPVLSGQIVKPMGSGVIYYDGATVHALNGRGQQLWTSTAGAGAGFEPTPDGVAIWADAMLTLLDTRGTVLYSGTQEKPILSANIGNMYAAVQIGTEHNSEMVILERGGRQIDRIDMNNVTVLQYGFFGTGNMLWVMTLNTEGTTPMCTVSTYQPQRMRTGTIEDTEQIMYQVLFQSSQIRVVGTTHIKTYDYIAKEKTDQRNLVYGWYLMGLDEDVDNPLMAFVPTAQSGGAPTIKDIRLIKGNQESQLRLPIACFSICVKNDVMYAFSRDYVFAARLHDGEAKVYGLPVQAQSISGITDNRTAIVTAPDGTYLVPLP